MWIKKSVVILTLGIGMSLAVGLSAAETKTAKKGKRAKAAAVETKPAVVVESDAKATLYARRSDFKKPLFRYERVSKLENNRRFVEVRFTELDGKLALEERVDYDENGKFRSFVRNHPQIQEKTWIEVSGGKVKFKREFQGKTTEKQEDWKDNYVSNDQLPILIDKNWADLAAGKTFDMRLMIPSRQESIGFSVEKFKPGSVRGEPTETFEMSPTSMILRSIVDPVVFHFMKERKLLLIVGRMPVKEFDGRGKSHDVEGELLFD